MSSVVKSFGKICLMVVGILYVILAIFVTICLLNFNDYRITVFGNKSLLLLKDGLGDNYKKNDLLVVTKDDGSSVKEGNSIFFYNASLNYTVNYAVVRDTEKHANGTYTFKIDGNHNVYTDYYIGKDPKVFRGVGGVLRVLESKWGFLLLIILPTMMAVIYEVYMIIIEIIEIKNEVKDE